MNVEFYLLKNIFKIFIFLFFIMIVINGEQHPCLSVLENLFNEIGIDYQRNTTNNTSVKYLEEISCDLPPSIQSPIFRENKNTLYINNLKKSYVSFPLLQLKNNIQKQLPESQVVLLEKCKNEQTGSKNMSNSTSTLTSMLTLNLLTTPVVIPCASYYVFTVKDIEQFVIKIKLSEKSYIVIESINNKIYILSIGLLPDISKTYIDEIVLVFGTSNISVLNPQLIPVSSYINSLHNIPKLQIISSKYNVDEINSLCEEIYNIIVNSYIDPTLIYCILAEQIAVRLLKLLNKTKYYIRSSNNGWKCIPMDTKDNIYYTGIVDSNTEFKIDTGIWIESYPIGTNMKIHIISQQRHKVFFNSITKEIYSLPLESDSQNFYIRGTLNNWELTPMNKDNFDYTCICSFDGLSGENLFKIDNGKWTESYPLKDISVCKGTYLIHFNLLTKRIKVVDLCNNVINKNAKFLCQEDETMYELLVNTSTTLDMIDLSLLTLLQE